LTMIKYGLKNKFAKSARAYLPSGLRSGARRAERFPVSFTKNQLLFMAGASQIRSGNTSQRSPAFKTPCPGNIRCPAEQTDWSCNSVQASNKTNRAAREKDSKNSEKLQGRRLNFSAASYFLSIAKHNLSGKNKDSGKFLIFHLPDLLKILSFRPFTLAPSNNISDQTLSIPYSAAFRGLRGQTSPFSVKIRAVLNKLIRSATHKIKFFSFF